MARIPMGAYEHSRVHFSILRFRIQFRATQQKTGLVLLQNGPPWAHRDPGSFRVTIRKERSYFASEYGPDPFGPIRTFHRPFFDPKEPPKQRIPKDLEHPHEKKGGDLEIGTSRLAPDPGQTNFISRI